MGAPEVLFVLLFAVPAGAFAGFFVARNRRRNSRHYVRALGRVAQGRPDPGSTDPDHDDFWRTP